MGRAARDRLPASVRTTQPALAPPPGIADLKSSSPLRSAYRLHLSPRDRGVGIPAPPVAEQESGLGDGEGTSASELHALLHGVRSKLRQKQGEVEEVEGLLIQVQVG